MITEERFKIYQMQANVISFLEVQFLMPVAGNITAITSAGLSTIQYKINSGSYATPAFPLAYAANDVITFTYSYTDQNTLRGNIILFGKDN